MIFRRFPLAPLLFFALWMLWLALPSTNPAALSQWKTRLGIAPSKANPGGDGSRDALIAGAMGGAGSRERADALALLGQKVPDDPTIAAQELVFRCDQLHLGKTRQPGPSSNPDLNWSVKLSPVEKPSPTLLKSWFATCARGGKLEPNNTFWDWMQIIGLLAARRDSEVWPVLKATRPKTGFDDHTSDITLSTLRQARLRNGAMTPTGQVAVAFATLFPHYATMREASRQLSDNASGLRLQGGAQNQKTALEGMRDLVFLGRTFSRESKWLIGSLVGQATESIALYGGTYSPFTPRSPAPGSRRPLPGAPLSAYAGDARSLWKLAKTQKRFDIAAQLATEWTAHGVWRTKSRKAFTPTGMEGIDGRNFLLASLGGWIGPVLVDGMPSLLALTLLCALALRVVRSWKREGEAVFPTRASWAGGALLGTLCVLALLSAALVSGFIALRAGSTPSNLMWTMMMSDADPERLSSAPPAWRFHLPTLALFVASLWCGARWEARRRGQLSLVARLRRVFEVPDDGLTRFDVSPLLSAIGVLAATVIASVGVVAFLAVPALNDEYASVHDYAGLILIGTAFVLALPALVRVRTSATRAFTFKLALRFAWAFLLVGSLMWGLLWLGTAPANRRFETQLDRFLKVGEFQLARQRLKF